MILSVRNFQCLCICTRYNVKGFYSGCHSFSYDFLSGTYVLQGEIDCGAWAFTDSISRGNKNGIFPESEIFIDGKNKINKINKEVWCVDDKLSKKPSKKSMYQTVSKLVKKYNSSLSAEKLLMKFGIPIDDIAMRGVRPYSHYYPCYVALVGYLKGYKIFTASWQGQDPFFKEVYIKIINALKDENCIFIIPSSEKNYYGENCTYINMYSLYHEDLRKIYIGK